MYGVWTTNNKRLAPNFGHPSEVLLQAAGIGHPSVIVIPAGRQRASIFTLSPDRVRESSERSWEEFNQGINLLRQAAV